MNKKNLIINGLSTAVLVDDKATLSTVLRKQLLLTGTKIGCNAGQCGACSVIMDGKVIRSCITRMSRVPEGARITTIEGIGDTTSIPIISTQQWQSFPVDRENHIDELHPLQLAWILHGGAQCGFCTPGFIVSAYQLLEENKNPSREDVRDWFQKHQNLCRCTGYKQLVDAVMDAAAVMRGEKAKSDLVYKMPADGSVWGTKYPRPTAVAKVTGKCDYGADVALRMPEETLQLALVQADVSHAVIKGIDFSEAEKMPGVYKIITHKDVQGSNRINGLVSYAQTNVADGFDRPILCDEKVFQYGDAIAIVAADTEANARAAAAKVKVDLEVLPAYMSAPEAMAEDAIEIHPGTPNVFFTTQIKKGDEIKPIFAKAPVTIEGDFYVGRQPHMPIEPDVGYAYIDSDGVVRIHSKSIAIHLHHLMICEGLGTPPEKLAIIQNYAGGTFGYKLSPTLEALLGVATMATGKPVVLQYNYHQQQTYTGKRSPFWINLKYAADENGKLLAMESDWSVDHGAYSELGDMLTLIGSNFMGTGYMIPAIRGEGRCVFTNHAWGSAFRSYGSPQSEFASETLMDMMAAKLGIDPWEIRYRNVMREGDTMPYGAPPDVIVLPQMFEKIKPTYDEWKERAKKNSTAERKWGVGISLGMYNCGGAGADPAAAAVQLNSDNTVTVLDGWEDHGQGSDMGSLGTAHEALKPLGLTPDKIVLEKNDTSKCPNSGPAGGSRSQISGGYAIMIACGQLLEAMKKADGSYRTYDEMVKDGIETKYEFTYMKTSTPVDPTTGQGDPYHILMYAVFLALVSVDVATGKTTVEAFKCLADIGKINNFLVVDGQMYGGIAKGIGLALSEDFEDIHKHDNMKGAGMPYIKDIPDEFIIEYQETPRKEGTFGAAGVGEAPLTTPHAAICNAIFAACGTRIQRLPAYPERVLAAMPK